MRVITVSDGFTSTSAPTQGTQETNALQDFATDAAFVSAKGSAAANGDVYYNTTEHAVKLFRASVWSFLNVGKLVAYSSTANFLTAKNSAVEEGDAFFDTAAFCLKVYASGAWWTYRPGTLPSYASDAAYVTGKGLAAAGADTYHNSTLNALRAYLGSSWETVLSTADGWNGFILNGTLSASVAANALTLALKTKAGADPSATDPVFVAFRSATITSGVYVVRKVTAATSVVVSSGSTLGHASGIPDHVYAFLIDNAGTVELAVSSSLHDEGGLVTTTAEGGAGAADSRYAIYSTTARTGVACVPLGRCLSSQATAGTWATAISSVYSGRPSSRQLAIGTANTSNVGSLTSTSYASAGAQTLTFTPSKTGRYRVSTVVHAYNTSASTQLNAKIAGSAGSPVVLFEQSINADSGAGSITRQMHPYSIYWLVAGTSYTFEVQYNVSSGTMVIRNDRPATGAVVVAELLD